MNKWQCKTAEGVARQSTAEASLKQIRIVCHPFELRRSVFRHLLHFCIRGRALRCSPVSVKIRTRPLTWQNLFHQSQIRSTALYSG
jgi:hypothetical protein